MMRLVEKENLDRKVVGDVMRKKGEEEKKRLAEKDCERKDGRRLS